MAGRGFAPKKQGQRRNRTAPSRGEWTAVASGGWQHGPIPKPPTGLTPASRAAWAIWFRAWYAAHWGPADLPGLRVVVLLYDQVHRGEHQRAAELRLWLDTYGLS